MVFIQLSGRKVVLREITIQNGEREGEGGGEKEREREREREREGGGDRQTDRQTETERQTDRQRKRQRQRQLVLLPRRSVVREGQLRKLVPHGAERLVEVVIATMLAVP